MGTVFSSTLGQDSVANTHEYSNELSDSTKDSQFLNYMNDCYLIKSGP